MYLETIYSLKKSNRDVRAIDVAKALKFSKPSVSRGLSLLREKNYISVTETGNIFLTDSGETKAKAVYDRHMVMTAFFIKIGAARELAEENACRIEHVICDELFEIIKSQL